MGTLLEKLLGVVLNYLKLWYDAERREAAEWEAKARAGQAEALKALRGVEKGINAPIPPSTAKSVSEWNRKAAAGTVAVLLALLMLSGCHKYVYIEGPWPEIDSPARPVLPAEPPEFTAREQALVDYAEALSTRLDRYNEQAKAHNSKHGYTDPKGEKHEPKVKPSP